MTLSRSEKFLSSYLNLFVVSSFKEYHFDTWYYLMVIHNLFKDRYSSRHLSVKAIPANYYCTFKYVTVIYLRSWLFVFTNQITLYWSDDLWHTQIFTAIYMIYALILGVLECILERYCLHLSNIVNSYILVCIKSA